MRRIQAAILLILGLLSANQALCNDLAKEAQGLAKMAVAKGSGKVRVSGKVLMQPTPLWRESYERSDNFEWDIYYQILKDGKKGNLFEKKVFHYRGQDIYMILYLDDKNNMIKFQKKITNTNLLDIKQRGLELDYNSFIEFDVNGHILSINQNLFLINNKNKEAYYSYITINDDAEIVKEEHGNYEYDQLTDIKF